jgi:hypothetical protein
MKPMVAENLLRDVKIGLRVLVKERTFCALAVVVLASSRRSCPRAARREWIQ